MFSLLLRFTYLKFKCKLYNRIFLLIPALQDDTVVSGTDRLLSSVQSVLKVTISGKDDGVQYWCKARHVALNTSADHGLIDIVTLTVLRE